MKFGIAKISIVPMRKEPSAESEMVSQVLFGEHYSVLKEENGWLYIQMANDGYKGWIDKRMYHEIPREQKDQLDKAKPTFAFDLTNKVSKNHSSFHVVLGSVLPQYDAAHHNFKVYPKGYHIEGNVGTPISEGEKRRNIIATASKYINSPYLWGGRTPFGIDCSGLTQMVFRLNNQELPRDSKDQVTLGKPVALTEAKPGDLAFFTNNNDDSITHVGIILENGEILHSSGTVHVDNIDNHGILCKSTLSYSHKLKEIRNIIE